MMKDFFCCCFFSHRRRTRHCGCCCCCCVRLSRPTTAPDDHVIQLDFRNNFNIELSPNCEYDFLEVKQTPHGNQCAANSALRHTMRPSQSLLIACAFFPLSLSHSISHTFSVWLRSQVRDGKYGFSDILDKFCGNQFPSIISSSDKYLWLYFHSDDNIEYIGFEGVYNFTARPANAGKWPDQVCRK